MRSEEAYTASLLAIEVDAPAAQHYLAYLATRLSLDATTVEQSARPCLVRWGDRARAEGLTTAATEKHYPKR